MSHYETINPTTEEVIETYAEHTESEIEAALGSSCNALKLWKRTDLDARANVLCNVADLLSRNKNKYAEAMAIEMGKPISQGVAEIEKCSLVCRYYAENAAMMLSAKLIESGRTKSYICYEPLGLIYAIMPWNFPFWQVFRFAAPNLIGGNGILLKHAPNVTHCSLLIESLFKEAGMPDGVFTNLLISPQKVPTISRRIIEHKAVAGVTLTGSGAAGAFVGEIAGRNLKKSVLELGGSDAYVIFEDADLELAAKECVVSRMSNAGQTCIAAKRFLVQSTIYSDFIDLFVEVSNKYVSGNPLDIDTTMGPLARKDLRIALNEQVKHIIGEGGRLVCGGFVPEGRGFFYPATVIADVRDNSIAFSEELFGPVATIMSFETEREAIELANSSDYGLGACVFTKDAERGERIAREEIIAGSVFVNEFVKSDPRLPFGGTKNSGYGRELSEMGIHEFMNIKTIVVR